MRQDKKLPRSRRNGVYVAMFFLIRIPGPKESSAIALHLLAKKKDSALMRRFGVSNTRIAQQKSREWHREHPQYSSERRSKDPDLARRNCEFTRERMRRHRENILFDKSKSILTQLVGNTATSCYLSRSAGWLFLCLPKARSLFRRGCLGHNRGQFRRIENHQARLPAGRLYDLSGALK